MTSIDLTAATAAASDISGEGFESLSFEAPRPLEEEIIARSSANYEPLPMLDVIFGRMVTAYAQMLKTQTGFASEVTGHQISYRSWADAVQALDAQGVVAMAKSSWGGDIAFAMDRVFLHASVGAMLGGTPVPQDVPARQPTTLEKAFAARLISESLDLLAQHVSRIAEVGFVSDTVEAPVQISSYHNGVSICAELSMTVQIGVLQGQVTILMPLQTLEPVRPQLGKVFLGEELGRDNGWREHFADQISGATMVLTAELHRLSLPLSDVLRWQPGVTIDLGVTSDHEAKLMCAGRAILHGATGRKRNGRLAMRITREEGEEAVRGDDDLLLD